MTDKKECGPWIPHKAGEPCPIPDAKAGEFEIEFQDGSKLRSKFEPMFWWWNSRVKPPHGDKNIVAYRLFKPSPDWKAIAGELAEVLQECAAFFEDDGHDKNAHDMADIMADCQIAAEFALAKWKQANTDKESA